MRKYFLENYNNTKLKRIPLHKMFEAISKKVSSCEKSNKGIMFMVDKDAYSKSEVKSICDTVSDFYEFGKFSKVSEVSSYSKDRVMIFDWSLPNTFLKRMYFKFFVAIYDEGYELIRNIEEIYEQ